MVLKNIKKFIGVLTAIIVSISPMAVMAAETTDIQDNTSEAVVLSMEKVHFDEDIRIYVSSIDATLTGHLKFDYSYDEGVMARIEASPKPEFYNVCIEGGMPQGESYAPETRTGNVMTYRFAATASGSVRIITITVYVDEYGSVYYEA